MPITRLPLDKPLRRFTLAAAALAILFGCALSVVWGFANTIARNGDVKEVTGLAASLSPYDPQARYYNAGKLERTFDLIDIDNSLREYELAAALSPHNHIYWLGLGQARERGGDRSAAEKAYRRAVELAPNYSRTRWALGNNLVRQGNLEEGFANIRIAVEQDRTYAQPAVTAALQVYEGDAGRAAEALGSAPAVIAQFVAYLAAEGRFDEAFAAWDRLPAEGRREDTFGAGKLLLAKLIEAKRFRQAVDVAARTGSDDTRRPRAGGVTNGGFESGVSLQNAERFDWQIGQGVYPQIALIEKQPKEGRYSLAVIFSDQTNLAFRPITQTIALEPGRKYELSVSYRGELHTKAQFRWEAASAAGERLAVSEPMENSAAWSEIKMSFVLPNDSDGINLRLIRENCAAPLCTVSGNLSFDDFRLTAAQ